MIAKQKTKNQKLKIVEEKSSAIEKRLDQYLQLEIGGKKIRCPYWIDKPEKGICGPFGGKGTPELIKKKTLELAKKQGLDLSVLSSKQIEGFFKKNLLGIDCSGLAYHLLDALDREKGGNGLVDNIPSSKGRFLWRLFKLPRANVKMLTGSEVSNQVLELKKTKVGDMIRMAGGDHILVVIRLKEFNNELREIIYAHSSNLTGTKGVHLGSIVVKDSQALLDKQLWLEKTSRGENFGKQYFWPEKGDGLKRFKVWEKEV